MPPPTDDLLALLVHLRRTARKQAREADTIRSRCLEYRRPDQARERADAAEVAAAKFQRWADQLEALLAAGRHKREEACDVVKPVE